MFDKVAVAIAASPTLEALLAESKRLQDLFDSELLLLHIRSNENKEEEVLLQKAVAERGFNAEKTSLFIEQGDPSTAILMFCRKHQVDLLVAGALKKENLFRSYLGSVGRDIIRAASCSLLILVEPSVSPAPFAEIVVDGSEQHNTQMVIKKACKIGQKLKANHIHILKDIKLYGLTMAMAGEDSEHLYAEQRRNLVQEELENIKRRLAHIDTAKLNINIKVISGKRGFEISRYARRIKADLIVMAGPHKKLRLMDRIMTHDLEYLLTDIPTNLLIIHN